MIAYLKQKLLRLFEAASIRPTKSDYIAVLDDVFVDVELTTEFYNIVVIEVVVSQFEPDIPALMVKFKQYDLNILEAQVVFFKIGALCQMLLEQPKIAFEEAIKIPDIFTAESIASMTQALEDLKLKETDDIILKYKEIKAAAVKVIPKSENELANNQIDAYLKKKDK